MVRRSVLGLLTACFLFMILVASTVSASGCAVERTGSIWLPFGPVAPPPVETPDLHTVFMFVLFDPEPGSFRLQTAEEVDPVFCLGSDCVHNPDFNIAFFQTDGPVHSQVGQAYSDLGPEEGTVPADADYAMVWMGAGYEGDFVFQQQCS